MFKIKLLFVGLSFVVFSIAVIFMIISVSRSEEITPRIGLANFESLSDEERTAYGKYIEIADSYSRQGRHGEVIQIMQKAIGIAPNEPQAYNFLCISYAALRNYAEAIKVSQKYIQILEGRNLLSNDAILRHVDFLLKGANKDEAINFLQQYSNRFSTKEIEMYIQILKSS